jgi:hypothetical protein
MFRCERCGSRYNAMHAVAIENCPRCQIRDRTTAPLTFKPFQRTDIGVSEHGRQAEKSGKFVSP